MGVLLKVLAPERYNKKLIREQFLKTRGYSLELATLSEIYESGITLEFTFSSLQSRLREGFLQAKTRVGLRLLFDTQTSAIILNILRLCDRKPGDTWNKVLTAYKNVGICDESIIDYLRSGMSNGEIINLLKGKIEANL